MAHLYDLCCIAGNRQSLNLPPTTSFVDMTYFMINVGVSSLNDSSLLKQEGRVRVKYSLNRAMEMAKYQ